MCQTNLSSLLVVILGSYNIPVYETMIDLRRKQLRREGIPYVFVIDGEPKIQETEDEWYYERTKETEQKTKIPIPFSNILFKYQKAIKRIITMPQYKHITHILRINVSTFINIDILDKLFPSLPKKEGIIGTCFMTHLGTPYLSGTAIIYTRDVMEYFATLSLETNPMSYEQWDDTAIGWLLSEKYKQQDILSMYWKDKPLSSNQEFEDARRHVFVRVRHDQNRDTVDDNIWKRLYAMDQMTSNPTGSPLSLSFSSSSKSKRTIPYHYIVIGVFSFVVLLFMFWYVMKQRQAYSFPYR